MLPTDKQAARFARGFKTWAENTALAVRSRLKLSSIDPLSCEQLAAHLGVHIWELSAIAELPPESLTYLTSKQGNEWSAVTVAAAKTVIVLNPSHSGARRSSSGMHELAHILRGHEPAQVTITPGSISIF